MYHQFMEGFYTPRLLRVLDDSPTNADMIRNYGRLEAVCQRLMPHIEAIVGLTSEGSETHQQAVVKLNSIRELHQYLLTFLK